MFSAVVGWFSSYSALILFFFFLRVTKITIDKFWVYRNNELILMENR